jgi:hypothetical protein
MYCNNKKNMARKLIILFITFLTLGNSQAQETKLCNCDNQTESITEPKLIGELFSPKKSIIGSQNFIDEWLDGVVLLSNNITVKNKLLRYNGFIDRVIWLVPGCLQQVKLDKESVDGFCLNANDTDQPLCFKKIKIKEELTADSVIVYAQELYNNRLSLYAYRKVEFSGREITNGKYYTDKFSKVNIYFFKLGNKTTGFKRFKKRDILKLFPGKKEQINNQFSTYKQRRFKSEQDLVRIAELLNGIVEN